MDNVNRWDNIHRESFSTWVNHRLDQRGLHVNNFGSDFSDGFVLIQLLEILSGKEVRRYTKNTRSAIQKLDNIHVALDFLENEMNLRVLGCNPQEIVDGNEKQMLGLIFLLIQYDKRRASMAGAASLSHIFRRRLASESEDDDDDDDEDTESESESIGTSSPRRIIIQRDSDSQLPARGSGSFTNAASAAAATAASTATSAVASVDGTRQHATQPTPTEEERETPPSEDDQSPPPEPSSSAEATAPSTVDEQLAARAAEESAVAAGKSVVTAETESPPPQQPAEPEAPTDVPSDVEAVAAPPPPPVPEVRVISPEEELARKAEEALQQIAKRAAKRRAIAEEMVSTERSYVQGLQTLIAEFLLPVQSQELLPVADIRNVFSQVESIVGCNQQLLAQLEAKLTSWTDEDGCVGKIFLGLVDYLKMYTMYINNYNMSVTSVTTCKKKYPKFAKFLEEVQYSEACRGLDITSYLIMPVQRLPRYVLLLEDMYRNTASDHADYETLGNAISRMRSVAEYVNEKKREAENLSQVLAIHERLSGKFENFSDPSRRYVCEGPLIDVAETGPKNRYVFLFNDMLIVASPPSNVWGSMWKNVECGRSQALNEFSGVIHAFKQTFELKDGTLSEPTAEAISADESLASVFNLYIPSVHKRFTLTAASPADKIRWLIHIDECLSQLLESKRSRFPIDEGKITESPQSTERSALREATLLFRTELGTWRPRRCSLFRDRLIIQKLKDGETIGPKVEVNVLSSSCKIASVMDTPNAFQILTPSKLYYVAANTGEEMLGWITQIRECIHAAIKRQQTLARRTASRQWPEDLDEMMRPLENQMCADCSSPEIANASLMLGVTLCNECSGIHRVLGLGGATIKSLRMRWKPEQIQEMQKKGNVVMNPQYLTTIPEFMERISRETPYAIKVKFIEAKYAAVKAAAASAAAPVSSSSLEGSGDGSSTSKLSGNVYCLQNEKKGVWVRRWLVLDSENLHVYKNDKSPTARLSIPLVTSGVKDSGKNEFGFDIVTPTRIYHFRANSDQEREKWVVTIAGYRETIANTASPASSSSSTREKRGSRLYRSWKALTEGKKL